jgi:hypothetical protein
VVPVTAPGSTFVHLACALWTPELIVANPEGMSEIKLDHLTKSRAQLKCSLCKQAGGAAV